MIRPWPTANRPLKIDDALAERLKTVAERLGKNVDAYVLQRLDAFTGLDPRKHDEAYWEEVDRICQEALRTGGVPLEEVHKRLGHSGNPKA